MSMRIVARGGRHGQGALNWPEKVYTPLGLTPLHGGHPLELNRQTGFEGVRGATSGDIM